MNFTNLIKRCLSITDDKKPSTDALEYRELGIKSLGVIDGDKFVKNFTTSWYDSRHGLFFLVSNIGNVYTSRDYITWNVHHPFIPLGDIVKSYAGS